MRCRKERKLEWKRQEETGGDWSPEARPIPEHLEHDASNRPEIHLVTVITACKQTLGRPIPPGGDVFGKRRLGENTATRAEIGEFKHFVGN